MEIPPDEFHIGITRGRPAVIAYKPSGSDKCRNSILLPESNPENFEIAFSGLESLLAKLDILSIPEHEPQKAFRDGPSRFDPALHVRFIIGDRVWQSWYSTNQIPPKIQELYDGCRKLSITVCERGSHHKISGEEAMDVAKKRMSGHE